MLRSLARATATLLCGLLFTSCGKSDRVSASLAGPGQPGAATESDVGTRGATDPSPTDPLRSAGPRAGSQERPDEAGSRKRPDEAGSKERPGDDTVTLFEGGRARDVSAAWARKQGYTILDLSDDWVPYPFTEETPGRSDHRPNSYRPRFVDLANDRTDHRGKPLAEGRRNFLELYGIPPSLSALRKRALTDEAAAGCYAALDTKALSTLDRSLHYVNDPRAARRHLDEAAQWENALKRLLVARKWKDAAEAETLARGQARATLSSHRLTATRLAAIRAAQARIRCEGLDRPEVPITSGLVDWHHHRAMVRFERRHMIFGWGQIWGETRTALLRTPRENSHLALLRVLRERLANQLGVIEDGSVPATLAGASEAGGVDHLTVMTQAAAAAFGVKDPEGALAFLTERPSGWFARRKVALRLPSSPAYHRPNMDLRAVIDRGDVWYDFPYDEQGRRLPQPIARRPHLTLHVHHEGRRLPLVRWATTIGGWRTEVHGRCDYWKYKDSDVGDRLWKYLVAAPVWLPPPGTPPRSLLTEHMVGGRVSVRPKEREIGPGPLSAYGLVAALHIREVRRGGQVEDGDDGIRTHGSADYMSIRTSHSHGCHRLHNHLAVRLASFLLLHRQHHRLGEQPVRWRYGFEHKGKRFSFERNHKGYYYRLDPPVPITVNRGRILGKSREPISRAMRKAEQNDAANACPQDGSP